jgi:hypothetical protein
MRSSFALGIVLAAGVASLLVPGAAAQVATQDSVTTSGSVSAGLFSNVQINATSGPSGENPSGQASFTVLVGLSDPDFAGPVTCLAVSGNEATLNIQDDGGAGVLTVQVTDGQPDSFNAFPVGRGHTDCSPASLPLFGGPLTSGEITVVDAPPLPTSKDQCKNGGWRNYGTAFKNEGDCASFVATGGKNPPAG